MTIYSLDEIITFARRNSPFYAELYDTLPQDSRLRVTDLPIIAQDRFWEANNLANNRLLTGPLSDAIVFKSGGTTGKPKFSIFTRREWDIFTQAFGRGLIDAGIEAGDRIANLFYVGDLYASFIFILDSIERAPVATLSLPISGNCSLDSMASAIEEFSANVLAVVPTTVCRLAEYLVRVGRQLTSVEKILFGGEALYDDQKPLLKQAFPHARVRSIGYASVDAGLLGAAVDSPDTAIHRAFQPETIIEILDEVTAEPITTAGVAGKIFVTSLTRRLMPIIRYPAGDVAEWVDYERRRFRILGRSEEGARIGPVTFYVDDLRAVVSVVDLQHQIVGMQIVLRHAEGKDRLVLRLATLTGEGVPELGIAIRGQLALMRPMFEEHVKQGQIHPLVIEWVRSADLVANQRSGKLQRLIDERRGGGVNVDIKPKT